MDTPALDSASNEPRIARGLKWLVAVHLVLSLSPGVPALPTNHQWLRSLRELTMGIPSAQMMLLIFWAGMGTSRLWTRLAGAVLGMVILDLMASLSFFLTEFPEQWVPFHLAFFLTETPESISSGFYPKTWLWDSCLVLFLAGLCRLIWGRIAELRYLPFPERTLPHAWFRFSIRHLLALTAVIAILLGMACSKRSPRAGEALVGYQTFLRISVPLVSVYGMWAVLGLGRLRWQIPLVTLVTIVLVGADMGITDGVDVYPLSFDTFIWSLNVTFMPVATVVGSLLVVRACGYRLIPTSSELAGRGEQPSGIRLDPRREGQDT